MPDRSRTPRGATVPASEDAREIRIYGFNACVQAFAARPQDLRKLWLSEDRVDALRPVMAHCARQRLGYRVVPREDLDRLSGSRHHEGVCMAVLRTAPPRLSDWLAGLPDGPAVALWLDGVGNPHNLGAILRSAAHFGVAGVIVPDAASLALSGAAVRVAEGGAEAVPLVAAGDPAPAFAGLRAAGFSLIATVVRGGEPLFGLALPPRLVLVMGAETLGVDPAVDAACDRRVGIPGTGAVESLNVSAATAVFLAEWARDRH